MRRTVRKIRKRVEKWKFVVLLQGSDGARDQHPDGHVGRDSDKDPGQTLLADEAVARQGPSGAERAQTGSEDYGQRDRWVIQSLVSYILSGLVIR